MCARIENPVASKWQQQHGQTAQSGTRDRYAAGDAFRLPEPVVHPQESPGAMPRRCAGWSATRSGRVGASTTTSPPRLGCDARASIFFFCSTILRGRNGPGHRSRFGGGRCGAPIRAGTRAPPHPAPPDTVRSRPVSSLTGKRPHSLLPSRPRLRFHHADCLSRLPAQRSATAVTVVHHLQTIRWQFADHEVSCVMSFAGSSSHSSRCPSRQQVTVRLDRFGG